ncbi:RNA polymerase sigma factor [Amycolatopsis sp. NPDC003865]
MTSDSETVPAGQGRKELAELHALVGPQVKIYARARTRRMDPDDIVHETVLRLRQHLDRNPGDESANLVPLALTIARNLVIDQSRAGSREVLLSAEDLIKFEALREEDFADRSVEIIDAHNALRALPEDLQEVVTLVCMNGCPVQVAAQILGITERTAQRRYRKARERLWRALRPQDG